MATISSPFAPRKRDYPKYVVPEEDIVEYERYDELVSSNPDNPADFVTVEKVREKSRINRKAYIEQFRDDVGIENILKKIAITGDTSLLNQINRPGMPIDQTDPEKREMVQDFVPIVGEGAASHLGDVALSLYKQLDKELVAGRSFEEFCKTITSEQVAQFINSRKDKDNGGNNDE